MAEQAADVDAQTKALIKRHLGGLPADPVAIRQFLIMGRTVVTAQRNALESLRRLDGASAYYHAKLKDTQELASLMLAASMKLGTLLSETEQQSRDLASGQMRSQLPEGIDRNESARSQKLAAHPDLVDAHINEAIGADEVPTQTGALRKIDQELGTGKVRRLSAEEIASFADYWEALEPAAKQLRSTYMALSRVENRHTPRSFSYFLESIHRMITAIESWHPDQMHMCPMCRGTGETESSTGVMVKCENCHQGKVGFYRKP